MYAVCPQLAPVELGPRARTQRPWSIRTPYVQVQEASIETITLPRKRVSRQPEVGQKCFYPENELPADRVT